jgi:nitrite reductase/ring-hydroxylating ferredoxin subunit
MSTQPDVFAICALKDIGRGDAGAFSLFRVTETGEARPFSIVGVRSHADEVVGYVNACPHQGTWLNLGDGGFFNVERTFLRCGRHGALFEIDSGLCIAGDCLGRNLEPVPVAVIGGEVCVCGIALLEDAGPDPFADGLDDETMEIMVHPD